MPFINFPDNPSIGDVHYVGIYKYVWTGETWDREMVSIAEITNSVSSQLTGTAPETLDTLGELADALGDDANFATTIVTALADKADKTGDTFTGPVILKDSAGDDILDTTNDRLDIKKEAYLTNSLSMLDVPTDNFFFTSNNSMVSVSGVPFRAVGTAGESIIETFPFDGNTAWYKGNEIATVVDLEPKADKTLATTALTTGRAFIADDAARVVTVNSGSAQTMTIPLNTTTDFPIGTEIAVIRLGAGTVTISPASGVTLNSIDNKRLIKGQYGSAVVLKLDTNSWVLIGSLE